MTRIQEVTITKRNAKKVCEQITWNFDLDGRPFGQVWTFKARADEIHMFHAKTLAGAYKEFATYKAAEAFMRGEM